MSGAWLRMFGAPAFRGLWTLSRDLYAPDFALYVDALLGDLPVSPRSDLAAAQLRLAVANLQNGGDDEAIS